MADIEVMEQVKDEKPELQGTAITRAELAELQKNPTAFKDFRENNKGWRSHPIWDDFHDCLTAP